MEAVDSFFEGRTHLNFIDEDIISFAGEVMIFNILIECVVIPQVLEIEEIEINVDDIRFGITLSNILFKRFE